VSIQVSQKNIELSSQWKLSFWDGLILVAATVSGAKALWSEDFNTDQKFGSVKAVNPLNLSK